MPRGIYPRTTEQLKHQSESHMGHIQSKETIRKRNKSRMETIKKRGYYFSDETKKKTVETRRRNARNKNYVWNPPGVGIIISKSLKKYYAKQKNNPDKKELLRRKRISKKMFKGGSRLYCMRSHNKRRKLGYENINEPFEGSQGHHIDKEHVVFIPKWLHKTIWHSLNKPESMEKINNLVSCWILISYLQFKKGGLNASY